MLIDSWSSNESWLWCKALSTPISFVGLASNTSSVQPFNVNQSSSSNSWWTAPPKLDKIAVGRLVLSHFREVIWQLSVGQSGSCNIFPIDDWVYCHCPNYLYAIVICLSFSVGHISLHIHIIPIRQDKSNQHKTAEKHKFLLVMNL